jgi:photosystem II stability/assembly factor-like uncharacterized protein
MQRRKIKKSLSSATISTFLLSLLAIAVLTACGNDVYNGNTPVSQGQPERTVSASAQTRVPGSSGSITSITSTSSTLSPRITDIPLTAIRMLDQMSGWALTQQAVLKTNDGGLHWRNVSPSPNPLATIKTQNQVSAAFHDSNHVWVVIPPLANGSASNTIIIMRTIDGGMSWFTSTIIDPGAVGTFVPDFINLNEGWLGVDTGAAAGSESVDIFHTMNGGATWSKIATTGMSYTSPSGFSLSGDKNGLSFKDAQTGWATAYTAATDRPWLFVTHDGGHTWQAQTIPTLAGVSNAAYETTPPVLFGNYGILPIHISTASGQGYDYYITHNGGQSWSPTILTNFDVADSYVVDAQHGWAYNGALLYATGDAGYHWTQVATLTQPIGALSFIDTDNGWAIGPLDGNLGLLFRTSDGGYTWQQIPYVIMPHE